MEPVNGIIISGLHSSSGKTAVTCLILAALQQRGIPVQSYKAGSDFIDPAYHTQFNAGTSSRNLDFWLMGDLSIQQEVATHTAKKIGIVEGVMGLFDGSDSQSDEGSTMALSRLLNWPILLVLPSHKAGRSLTASLRGFIAEAGPGRIIGIILNQVSGESHGQYLREALAPQKIPIIGVLPLCEELRWPERHLGLQASQEGELPSSAALAQLAEKHLDIPHLLSWLRPAPEKIVKTIGPKLNRRVGIARDQAFHFYYQANLDYLRDYGVELVDFSPLHDTSLPDALDGIILGGGFPELFAEQLSSNSSLRQQIKEAILAGMPCYAECGGLMYLGAELIMKSGEAWPMVGVVPGAMQMTDRLQNFGYCSAVTKVNSQSHIYPGHEFHHSLWQEESAQANRWEVRGKRSGLIRREGFRLNNLHASYVHLHFATSGSLINFLFNLEADREAASL